MGVHYEDIESLPEKYREQARQKLIRRTFREDGRNKQTITEGNSREEAVKKKYKNRERVVDGIRFDSQKEARRFILLRDMEDGGFIRDLRLQVEFTLQEAYTTSGGQRVRAIRYRADFTYYIVEPDGTETYVVEDVKSKATKTRVYQIKRKLLLEKFGIEIREV